MRWIFPILLFIIYLVSSGCSTEPEWVSVRNKVTVSIDIQPIRDEFKYDSVALKITTLDFESPSVDSVFVDSTFLYFDHDSKITTFFFPKEGQTFQITAHAYYANNELAKIDDLFTLPSDSLIINLNFTKESCYEPTIDSSSSVIDSTYCIDYYTDSVPAPVLTSRIKQFAFADSLYFQELAFDFSRSNDSIEVELHYANKFVSEIGGISLIECTSLVDSSNTWCLVGTPQDSNVRDYELSKIVVKGLYTTEEFPFKLNIFKEETRPYLATIDGIGIPLGTDFYPIKLDSLIYDEQHPYDSLDVSVTFGTNDLLKYDTLLLKEGVLQLSTIGNEQIDLIWVTITVKNSFGRADSKSIAVVVYNNVSSNLKIDSAYVYNYTIKVGEDFDTLDITDYAYDSELDSLIANDLSGQRWKVIWYDTDNDMPKNLDITYLKDDSLLVVTPKEPNWVGSETIKLYIRTKKEQRGNRPIDSLVVSVTFKVESKNIARLGIANQSDKQFPSLNADMAIDGNTDGDLSNKSVTTTYFGQNERGTQSPWWNLDLNDQQFISTITLWNRTDTWKEKLNNFVVIVSNNPFETNVDDLSRDIDLITSGQDITVIYDTIPEEMTSPERDSITYMLNRRARYIRIQMLDTAILQLAEVEIFGVISKEPIIRPDMEYVITTDNSISGPNSSIHIEEQNISDSLLSLAGVTGAESQQWRIEYVNGTENPQLYSFVNSESEKCLTVHDTKYHALVVECDEEKKNKLQQFKLVTTGANDLENPERIVYGIETAQQFQASITVEGENTSKIIVSKRRLSIETEGEDQGVRFSIPTGKDDLSIDQHILFRAAPRVRY
ncbi:MAG: discoidin domain-containing protein [Fibrobacterales bacterium]